MRTANLQGDFFHRQSVITHRVDAAAEQVFLKAPHQRDQFGDIVRAADQKTGDGLEIDRTPHHGWLDLGRQVADIGNPLLHLIHGLTDVRIVVEAHVDEGVAVAGAGIDLVQLAQSAQLLLDRGGDQGFQILCAGADPSHFDEHHRELHRGIELGRHHPDCPDTGQDHHDHGQIGGDPVGRESSDQRITPHDGQILASLRTVSAEQSGTVPTLRWVESPGNRGLWPAAERRDGKDSGAAAENSGENRQ